MTKIKHHFSAPSLAALALVLFVTAGCDYITGETSEPTGSISTQSFIQMAPTAPPAPRIEEIPGRSSMRTSIWRPGYWEYTGSDFHWVAGELIDRPSPTAIWSADHWIEHTYGWAFVPGYWQ